MKGELECFDDNGVLGLNNMYHLDQRIKAEEQEEEMERAVRPSKMAVHVSGQTDGLMEIGFFVGLGWID